MAGQEGRWVWIEGAWSRGWAVVILVASIAALVAVMLDLPAPIRPLLTIGFAAICPGMALVRLLRLGGPLVETMLAVALSLALAGIVAGIQLYLGTWAPVVGIVILAVVSWVGLALDASLVPRSRWAAVGDRLALTARTAVRGAPAVAEARSSFADQVPRDGRPSGRPAGRLEAMDPARPVDPSALPPPPVAVVRRRPADSVVTPTSRRRRIALADDPLGGERTPRALRTTIEQVVDDLADLRDGKKP